MKFSEYLHCEGCGKMIPKDPCLIEGMTFCSRECYNFIQWYKERKTLHMKEKEGRSQVSKN